MTLQYTLYLYVYYGSLSSQDLSVKLILCQMLLKLTKQAKSMHAVLNFTSLIKLLRFLLQDHITWSTVVQAVTTCKKWGMKWKCQNLSKCSDILGLCPSSVNVRCEYNYMYTTLDLSPYFAYSVIHKRKLQEKNGRANSLGLLKACKRRDYHLSQRVWSFEPKSFARRNTS